MTAFRISWNSSPCVVDRCFERSPADEAEWAFHRVSSVHIPPTQGENYILQCLRYNISRYEYRSQFENKKQNLPSVSHTSHTWALLESPFRCGPGPYGTITAPPMHDASLHWHHRARQRTDAFPIRGLLLEPASGSVIFHSTIDHGRECISLIIILAVVYRPAGLKRGQLKECFILI